MSDAARRAPKLSRSTFRKTCAEARSGGVFSAAMQSGRHISCTSLSVWSKRASSSDTLQSWFSCQPIQRAAVEKRASASLSGARQSAGAQQRQADMQRRRQAGRDEMHAVAFRIAICSGRRSSAGRSAMPTCRISRSVSR